jgi:hypothetical protein
MTNLSHFYPNFYDVPSTPSVGELKQLLIPLVLNADGLWEDDTGWLWYPIRGQSIGKSTSAADIAVNSLEKLFLALYPYVGSVAGFAISGTPASAQEAWDNGHVLSIPDYRGRSPIAAGQGTGLTDRPIGTTGGEEEHILVEDEMPEHEHGLGGDSSANHNDFLAGSPNPYGLSSSGAAQDSTLPSGGGLPHNNMQPWFSVEYVLALGEKAPPQFLVDQTVATHEAAYNHDDIALVDNIRTPAIARNFLELDLHKFVAPDPYTFVLNNYAVSTSGEVVTLTDVPTDRLCLVNLGVSLGFAASGTSLKILLEPNTHVNREDVVGGQASWSHSAPALIFQYYYAAGNNYGQQYYDVWVPVTDGKVYMRRDGTFFAGYGCSLWIKGWFEGDPT